MKEMRGLGTLGRWEIVNMGPSTRFLFFFSSFRLRGIVRGRDDGESRVDDYCLTDVRLLAR